MSNEEVLRKIDGDVIVNANLGAERYTYAAQTLGGAIAMARLMRKEGFEVKIRSWDGSVYQSVHA